MQFRYTIDSFINGLVAVVITCPNRLVTAVWYETCMVAWIRQRPILVNIYYTYQVLNFVI